LGFNGKSTDLTAIGTQQTIAKLDVMCGRRGFGKDFLSRFRSEGRLLSCVRPAFAVRKTAGPDASADRHGTVGTEHDGVGNGANKRSCHIGPIPGISSSRLLNSSRRFQAWLAFSSLNTSFRAM
jgi:hypothetical protein